MRRLTKLLLSSMMIFCCLAVQAQQVSVRGKVTDPSSVPMAGVTVQIKGTTTGTTTSLSGEYVINAERGQQLVFNYVGMATEEKNVSGELLNVQMREDATGLDEVVVIGYQTVRKADLTGAVSVFNPAMMKNKVVTGTVADVLQGLPGVFARSSGQPGAEGFVEIRGTGTFGSGAPLYVIDGVAVDGGANRDFNFNDVESIQVLKDASAAAIYGSRAGNGVIIVTTKKGKSGQMKIDLSAKTTLQWLPRYNLADRDRWIELNDMAFSNAGKGLVNHDTANTNWQDEVFKTGLVQDYNLSFSGGTKFSNYFISGNYQTNDGATQGTNSERVTVRVNTSSERQFGDNVTFRVGENFILSNYNVNELTTNPITDVWRMLPTIPVYNSKNPGGYGYGNGADVTFGSNPIAMADLVQRANQNLRLRGNAFAELELFKHFKYRFNLGFESSSDSYKNLRKEGNWSHNQPYDPSSLEKRKASFISMIYDNTLEFNKDFGKHSINAVAGTSFMSNNYERLWGLKNNVLSNPNGYYEQLDGALTNPKTGSYQDLQKLFSVFGRVNYAYDDRYLFSFTIRRDESSKFGPNYRSAVFPSVALGWKISNEKFFNVDWIDALKIRANYGVLGTSNIGVWDWVPFINSFPQAVFGAGQNVNIGMTQVKLSNADLKWEELYQMNAGIDLAVLKNRLTVEADYYIKDTKDILTPMQVLMTTGNSGGNPNVNAASVRNKGIELNLNWKDRVGEVTYNVGFGGSYNKNEILKLGYGKTEFTQWDTKSKVGESIGQWYLIKTDGLFRSDEDVLSHVNSNGQLIQPNAKPGDIRYVDGNDDGQINDADRQYCGETIPRWNLSLNAGVQWRGFDFSVMFNSSLGHKIFNGPRSGYDRFDDNSSYRANYDPFDAVMNPNGKDPRPLQGDTRNAAGNQDRWLENGNYLRLSQLALGYSFPKSILGNSIEGVRVFVNLQNIWTLTNYTGLDPEIMNTNIWDRSYDNAAFPTPKGLTFGAQITF